MDRGEELWEIACRTECAVLFSTTVSDQEISCARNCVFASGTSPFSSPSFCVVSVPVPSPLTSAPGDSGLILNIEYSQRRARVLGQRLPPMHCLQSMTATHLHCLQTMTACLSIR